MAETEPHTRADWRPPTDADWRRLRTLLRDVRIYLEMNADHWEQAERDVRTIGGEHWSIGIGRYADRAARSRELATWVEDEFRALQGGHQRKVRLRRPRHVPWHVRTVMDPAERVPRVRWEDLDDRAARCPRCLHWWVSHGVPTEDDYACSMPTSSMDERERGIFEVCGCTLAEGNAVTPRQVRLWTDGTSWPLAPWQRADCGHARRGPIGEDGSRQCLDCGSALST